MAATFEHTETVRGDMLGREVDEFGLVLEFADDSGPSGSASVTTPPLAGVLASGALKMGTPTPTTLTVTITDQLGVVVYTETLTDSGYLDITTPKTFFPGPLTVTISGNVVASAEATLGLTVIG